MNWNDLITFRLRCEALDVEPPAALLRGLELAAVADAHAETPAGPVLSLSDDELRDRVTAISIREHGENTWNWGRGMGPGVLRIKEALAAEVRDACLPELERIVVELQPRFDEAVRPLLLGAQEHGFTYATTSDELVRAGDLEAITAWREIPKALQSISLIASFRILISTAFDVSPTKREAETAVFPGVAQGLLNHSVSFAAGDNWSLEDGYYLEGKSGTGHLDWLALAEGGLRLNTPEEVHAKLDARGSLYLEPDPDVRTADDRAYLEV